ncbi:MAG: hypothetical protein AAF353_02950 [Pseudomonadota bacterium]
MKIKQNFRIRTNSLLLCLALCLPQVLSANSLRIFSLSADEWARPRSGEVIPELVSIRAAVSYWDKGIDALILIRYPGEDSGELWAAELRDWLISLGVPADFIELASGTQEADEIKLIVGNRDELEQ